MSFTIIYSDVFQSEKTVVSYENGSLLDAIKNKYPLNYQDVIVSSKTDNGVFEIPTNMLPYFRPKNGEYIAFVQPKDNSTLRIGLTIALIAAGQAYLAPSLIGAGFSAGVAGALVAVGSTYLASAIVPYKTDSISNSSDARESSTSTLSGSGNPLNKGGTVPYLIGTHKYSPPKSMQPITEYVNKTHAYLTEVFCLGYGPLIIDYDTIKLGETKLSDYDNVELQVKDNYKNSSPITLVSGIVDSAVVSATFSGAGDTAIRTTSTNCERIDVEIGYPSLTGYNDKGNRIPTSCVYRLDYREVGTDQWIGFNGSEIEDTVIASSGASTITLPNGEKNDTYIYTKFYVNESYFTFPNGVPSHIQTDKYFTIYGSQYNSGSFYAYSISGNNVFVGGYDVYGEPNDKYISRYGRTLVNESTAITYDPLATPLNSTDTDSTSVATYRTHTLTNIKKGQYDVRVTRITSEPSGNSNTRNQFQWTQLKSTQLTDDNGIAIVPFSDEYCYIGLRIKATDQLNGAINNLSLTATSVCYEYNEEDQSLTGNLASGNPAWEYLKVLNGVAAKQRVDLDEIDIDAFIEWSDLCDEQVVGSDGVARPRFRINTVIDSNTTEEDVLQKIASIGRASRRWVDFKESVIIDKSDIQPSIFLSPANIVSFKWEKSFAKKADGYRMSFYNKDTDYEQDELLVKIDDSVADNDLGYIEDLDATGITDPDQVYRYGKFAHAQLKLRPETYTATLGANSRVFLRGDVVALTHDRVQGVTCFGQVLAREGLILTVDNPFNISNDDLPLYATFSDPDSYEQSIATYTITDITDNLITFASLPSFNVVESYYSIGSSIESLTRLYMVKGITSADDLTATVQLVDYASPEIYDAANSIANYVSGTVDFKDSKIYAPVKPEVVDIITDESVLKINIDGSLSARALVVLSTNYKDTSRPEPKTVEIYYRPKETNGTFSKVIKNIEEKLYIDDIEQSLSYDFKIRYVSEFSAASDFAYETDIVIIGKTSPPPDVGTIIYKDGKLSWDYANAPIDFAGFRIRYSTGGVAAWEDAVPLDDGTITTNSYDASGFVASVNSFLIKAIDTSGNFSENAARIVINLGKYDPNNIVTTVNKFNDQWPDVIVNGYIDVVTGYLCNDTTEFYGEDDDLFYNVNDNELFYSVNNVEMYYEFSFTPEIQDRGASMFIEIDSSIESAYLQWIPVDESPFYTGEDTDLFYGNDDSFFYGLASSKYTIFNGFVSSIKAAEYKFRVVIPANKQSGSCLRYVKIIVDVEDIDETIDDFVVSGGEARLPIQKNYRSIENIQVTLQDNSVNSVSVKIVDKNTINGPLIRVFDSMGALIESAVDARIRGY